MKKGVQRVLKSCSNCRRAHAACDEGRPCRRCITTNQQSTCKDLPPRKRGRKAPAETNQGSSSDGFEAPASSSPTTSVSSAKRPKKRNVSAAAANDQTSASSSSSASSTVQYEDGAPPFLISHFYSRSPLPEDDSNNSNSNVKPTQSPPPYSHFTPSPSPPPPASFSSSSSSAVASPFQPMMEPPHGTQLLSLQPTLPPQQPSPQQQLAIMDPQILLQQMENMRQSFTSITEQLVAGQRQLQEEVEQLRDILFFRHSSSTTSTSPSRLSHRHQQHSITYHQMNNNNSSNNNGGRLRLTLEEEAREESSTSSPSSSSPPQTSFTSSSPADFPPSYPSPQPPSYHHPSDWSQPNNFASLPSSSASSSAIPFQSFSHSSSSPSSSSSASSSTSSFHSFNTFSPSFAEVLPSFPVPRTGPNFFTLPPEVDYYNPAIHPHRFNSMEGEASSTLAHLPLRMPDQNRPYILVKGNTAMGLYITSMNQSFLDLFGFTWAEATAKPIQSLGIVPREGCVILLEMLWPVFQKSVFLSCTAQLDFIWQTKDKRLFRSHSLHRSFYDEEGEHLYGYASFETVDFNVTRNSLIDTVRRYHKKCVFAYEGKPLNRFTKSCSFASSCGHQHQHQQPQTLPNDRITHVPPEPSSPPLLVNEEFSYPSSCSFSANEKEKEKEREREEVYAPASSSSATASFVGGPVEPLTPPTSFLVADLEEVIGSSSSCSSPCSSSSSPSFFLA